MTNRDPKKISAPAPDPRHEPTTHAKPTPFRRSRRPTRLHGPATTLWRLERTALGSAHGLAAAAGGGSGRPGRGHGHRATGAPTPLLPRLRWGMLPDLAMDQARRDDTEGPARQPTSPSAEARFPSSATPGQNTRHQPQSRHTHDALTNTPRFRGLRGWTLWRSLPALGHGFFEDQHVSAFRDDPSASPDEGGRKWCVLGAQHGRFHP